MEEGMRGLPAELVPLVLFLLLSALFLGFGVYLLVRPTRAAEQLADRDGRGALRRRDARALGAVFVVGSSTLLIVGIVRLALVLLGGVGHA